VRLTGKIAIVTGGGGGMGGGICSCLIAEGATVVISDLDQAGAERRAKEIEGAGGTALAVRTDVTDEADCEALVARSLEAFGQVDILVNNAGHFGERLGLPFTNQTAEDWDSNYAVNVRGPFLLCKAVARHMMERRAGRIINISSVAAQRDAQILPDYVAAKNAELSLTRVVAKDLGPYDVTVNAICPGLVWTNFWNRLAPLVAGGDDSYTQTEPRAIFEEFVRRNVPLQREQKPEDIGNLVVFLASDEAKNITGQSINVDGGMSPR